MITFFLLLTQLWLTSNARGESRFPACKNEGAQIAVADRECSPHHSDLKLISMVTRDVEDKSQAEQVTALLKVKVANELQKNIDAREILLKCFDDSKNQECEQRIRVLRETTTGNLKKLRTALALSQIPYDLRDHSVNQHITLPAYLGEKPLEPLSAQELEAVSSTQKNALEQVDEFLYPGEGRGAASPSRVKLRRDCQLKTDESFERCIAYENYKRSNFAHYRGEMKKISEDIISRYPFVTRFDSLPITDEKLKRELKESLSGLQKWRKETLTDTEKNNEQLLLSYPGPLGEVLHEHPELCAATDQRITALERSEKIKDYSITAAKLVIATGTCVASGPLTCATVAGALSLPDVGVSAVEFNRARERFAALDPDSRLYELGKVKDAYTDLLTKIAVASVAILPLGQESASGSTQAAAGGAKQVARNVVKEGAGQVRDEVVGRAEEAGLKASVTLLKGTLGNDDYGLFVYYLMMKDLNVGY